jgi:hypothetical protein
MYGEREREMGEMRGKAGMENRRWKIDETGNRG